MQHRKYSKLKTRSNHRPPTNATTSESYVNTVHSRRTPDRFGAIGRAKKIKEKGKENVKRNFRGDNQLPAKFEKYRRVFLEILTEVQAI